MLAWYGRSVVAVVFLFALTVSPYAHAAETSPVAINNPFTDALELWSAVFQSIESMAQQVASVLQPPIVDVRSIAATAGSKSGRRISSARNTAASRTQQRPREVLPAHQSLRNYRTQPSRRQPIISLSPIPSPQTFAAPAPANAFVTQDQFNAALSNRINPLIGIMGNLAALLPSLSASSAATPQWVAGNGNPQILGPAAPINQLSNVTITNPTSLASLPALSLTSPVRIFHAAVAR